jgi:hypothetical protein
MVLENLTAGRAESTGKGPGGRLKLRWRQRAYGKVLTRCTGAGPRRSAAAQSVAKGNGNGKIGNEEKKNESEGENGREGG